MFGKTGTDNPAIIFKVPRDDFCILNIIINKIGSKMISLEIGSSIDDLPSMT